MNPRPTYLGLAQQFFPRAEVIVLATATVKSNRHHARLARFMSRPQRHRLLHGFPLAAAMPFADADVRRMAAAIDSNFEPSRNPRNPLLIGVLPHPFCNPKISGCGFCTFPHEAYSALKAAATSNAVSQEIAQRSLICIAPRLAVFTLAEVPRT
jgi:oxygen-independent coproporphyrinogen-3 oxidase